MTECLNSLLSFATNPLEGVAFWTLWASSVYLTVLWSPADGLEASVSHMGKDVSRSIWLPLSLLQWNSCAKIIWKCSSGHQSRPNAPCHPIWKALHNSRRSWISVLWRASAPKKGWESQEHFEALQKIFCQSACLDFVRTGNYLNLHKTLRIFREPYLGPISA